MALDFSKSNKMVNEVMVNAEDNMDEKKRDIPVEQIDEYPMNEYLFGYQNQEFANEVIKEDGFHGAIEVCAMDNGRYQILSGHRRYRACVANGYKTIPCIVNEYLSDEDRLIRVIRGNITHRALTPLNYARCLQEYENLLKSNKDTKRNARGKVAKFFNLSEATVSRFLSINTLIPEFQELCDQLNFPYTNILPITFKPKEVQKNLYYRLYAMAPDHNIAGLSRNVIEQQVNMVLKQYEKENPDSIAKSRTIEVRDDSKMTDDTQSQPFTEFATEEETAETEEESSVSVEQKNVSESILETETEDDDVFAEPEPVEIYVPDEQTKAFKDKEVNYYIDKIDSITQNAEALENKKQIIERLKNMVKRLEK